MLRKLKKPQRQRCRPCVLDHTNETLLRNQGSKKNWVCLFARRRAKKIVSTSKDIQNNLLTVVIHFISNK
jgi:hypothetical protein